MSTMRKSGISMMLAGLCLCAAGPQIAAQTSASNPPATTFSSLFSFDSTDGEAPQAALIQATNGTFYGTTAVGGSSSACNSPSSDGCGTVFSLSVGLAPFAATPAQATQ
jgi:hypothetical protein